MSASSARLLPLATSLTHLNTEIWVVYVPTEVKDLNSSAAECAATVLIAFSHWVLTLDAAAILSMSVARKNKPFITLFLFMWHFILKFSFQYFR